MVKSILVDEVDNGSNLRGSGGSDNNVSTFSKREKKRETKKKRNKFVRDDRKVWRLTRK